MLRLRKWLPVAVIASTLLLAVLLPLAIFLTAISFQWIAFLVGILVAASLSLASRASRARWLIARRDAQLRSLRERLARETAARVRAQELLASAELISPAEMAHAAKAPAMVTASGEEGAAPESAGPFAMDEPSPPPEAENAAEQIADAIANDHFSLYLREVVRIRPGSSVPAFHEVLLRLDEEDDYHLPAGAFLALAAEAGMLPALDEWQFGKIVRWIAADPARRMGTWAVNVSVEALAAPSFVARVQAEMRKHRVAARGLCIGVGVDDLLACGRALSGMRRLRSEGCRLALTGFRGDAQALALAREIKPDYLKMDAGLVVGIARDERQASRLAALNRVAHAGGISTVAECVEDGETIRLLVGMGVDFAQGSAISGWVPLPRDSEGIASYPTQGFAAVQQLRVAQVA